MRDHKTRPEEKLVPTNSKINLFTHPSFIYRVFEGCAFYTAKKKKEEKILTFYLI